MKLRGARRAAVVTGAAVLATAMSGAVTASARTPESVCSAEIYAGAISYKLCSNTYYIGSTEYGTEPFAAITNHGIVSANVTVTHQLWNYSTNAWETDSSGGKLVGAGSSTQYYSPSRLWPCGTDAPERVQVDSGAWAELTTLAEC